MSLIELIEQEIHIHHHHYPDGYVPNFGKDKSSEPVKSKLNKPKVSEESKSHESKESKKHESKESKSQEAKEKSGNVEDDTPPSVNHQVAKVIANKVMRSGKPKDLKEVFIRQHVRRYFRKPSIGMMKQKFGKHV